MQHLLMYFAYIISTDLLLTLLVVRANR